MQKLQWQRNLLFCCSNNFQSFEKLDYWASLDYSEPSQNEICCNLWSSRIKQARLTETTLWNGIQHLKTPLTYWCKSWLVVNTVLIMVKHWRCNSKTELRRAQISCWSTAEGGKNKQGVSMKAGIDLHRPEPWSNTATKLFYKFFFCQISRCFAEGFSYH